MKALLMIPWNSPRSLIRWCTNSREKDEKLIEELPNPENAEARNDEAKILGESF